MALALLLSCRKEDNREPTPELIPVQIATTITGATDHGFEAGDNAGLFVVNSPKSLMVSGNHADNSKFTFNDTKWNAEKEIYWLDATTKADFYCYCPYTSSVSSTTAFPFQVSLDQSTESGYKASDFLWGKVTGVSPTPNPVMIAATHRMSCMIVNLKTDTSGKEYDINNAEVTLCGLRISAQINLTDGTVTADGNASEIKPNSVGNGSFRALVVPQTVPDAELVKVKIGENTYVLKTTIELQSGKQHTCTVDVNQSSEGINVEIGPWETDDYDYGGSVE